MAMLPIKQRKKRTLKSRVQASSKKVKAKVSSKIRDYKAKKVQKKVSKSLSKAGFDESPYGRIVPKSKKAKAKAQPKKAKTSVFHLKKETKESHWKEAFTFDLPLLNKHTVKDYLDCVYGSCYPGDLVNTTLLFKSEKIHNNYFLRRSRDNSSRCKEGNLTIEEDIDIAEGLDKFFELPYTNRNHLPKPLMYLFEEEYTSLVNVFPIIYARNATYYCILRNSYLARLRES